MHRLAGKHFWLVLVSVGVVVGCGSVMQQTLDEAAELGLVQGDNRFTEAPVGPNQAAEPVDPTDPNQAIDRQLEEEGEATQSFFTAFQIDPEAEDSAGPKFIISEDIDRDGLLDMVSAWNESQPVQLHLQRRADDGRVSFKTINLGGTSPIAITAGVEVGHINDDEWLDIVVLVKSTGYTTICPPDKVLGVMDGKVVILFNPGRVSLIEDGDWWRLVELPLSNEFPGLDAVGFYEAGTKPELAGYTGLAVGEIDGLPGDDIVTAFNAAECEELGQKPPINTLDLFPNPGGILSEDGTFWPKINLISNLPTIKDVELLDVDDDGDLDVISTWPEATSSNIVWSRNPLVPHREGGAGGTDAVLQGSVTWEERPLGHVATGADVIALGDVDNDGFDDVVVRSTNGRIVQWFRHPSQIPVQPIFPPPNAAPGRTNFTWQVYTLAQFTDQEPEAIAVGDVTGDGLVDVMIAAEGAVYWYDGTVGDSVFDDWPGNTMIRDEHDVTEDVGVGVTRIDVSAYINDLLVVDLDGDGKNDVLGTLDRRSGNGLSDDRLVWYRNSRSTEESE
jgi:hypothetical protein